MNNSDSFTIPASAMEKFLGQCMPFLDERLRRLFAAAFAEMLEHGGKKFVSAITGLSYPTLARGAEELIALPTDAKARPKINEGERVRKGGGGRKSIIEHAPEIDDAIMQLIDGYVVGTPTEPLCWTTKSTYIISKLLLEKYNIKVSPNTVAERLRSLGFSLQQNKKYIEKGAKSPDRDEQFRFINNSCKLFFAKGFPVISVDTKKKELVGNYKNNGAEYRPKGQPRLTYGHDFQGEGGKAAPYGIYDIQNNEGFVNVGTSSDTAEFAVASIKRWWQTMGKDRYPNATELMITADCGGSNSVRGRLWKTELQKFSNETNLSIHVSHFPPGTSKWNKIEHRLFAQISRTWRGQPLETLEVIVSLIQSTTTNTGLKVQCELDRNNYERGIKVEDEELAAVNIERNAWRGDWNYVIRPQVAHD